MRKLSLMAAFLALVSITPGCGGNSGNPDSPQQPAAAACPALSGSAWVPRLPSTASTPASKIEILKDVQTLSGTIIGAEDGATSAQLVTAQFSMPEDLGPNGSIALTAEVTNFPVSLSGSAYPALVSLHDGENDWIGLSQECADSGFFECVGSNCAPAAHCKTTALSAYADIFHWGTHQFNPFANLSVNTFPTCNWPDCAFNSKFFVDGSRLRAGPGVRYTAKFAMLSDHYGKMPASLRAQSPQAEIRLTVIRKKDNGATPSKLNINIVLVGSENIRQSRTPKGMQNLDRLLAEIQKHYGQAGIGINVGEVRAIEWTCEQGGDAYANVDVADLPSVFQKSLALLPAETDLKSVNLFLVSTIGEMDANASILGLAGALGGPATAGTAASGVAVASFNQLERFNPRCTTLNCPEVDLDHAFLEIAITASHEMGHYLGLSHVSESDGTIHDELSDTPVCTKTQMVRGHPYITNRSCSQDSQAFPPTGRSCADACAGYNGTTQLCPTAYECEFNHLMWWTTKSYDAKTGIEDGNLLSSQSGTLLRASPLVQ